MEGAKTRWVGWWQLAFVWLGTSWLWAPQLNILLSSRVSLISQYEAAHQPYAWLFRLGDFLAAVLLTGFVWLRRRQLEPWVYRLLLIIGLSMMIDPLVATSCRDVGNQCQEFVSLNFIIHAIESVAAGFGLFALTLYDAWRRQRLVSLSFLIFQVLYGLLFLTQLASHNRFNTLSQFIYQTVLVLWLAWFVGEQLASRAQLTPAIDQKIVRLAIAGWAFFNGFLAIFINLLDLDALRNNGFYFANDTAWLAQHGVIVGVVMIYLSRHLARGERRARQLFLLILGGEVLKYSLVSPHPLLIVYVLSFGLLFVERAAFDRGPMGLTWRLKFKEIGFLLGSITVTAGLFLGFVYSTNEHLMAVKASLDHFYDYVVAPKLPPHTRLHGVLLAHTYAALLLAVLLLALWIVFRPGRVRPSLTQPQHIKDLLERYSTSPEDFFKLWPADKDYFVNQNGDGFIAYKIAGPVMFALADPIAPSRASGLQLIEDFLRLARDKGLRVCFLPIEAANLPLYKGLNDLQIGASALIKIDHFLTTTVKDKWWRWKTNRAVKGGYLYNVSYPPHSDAMISQFRQVSDAWLSHAGRKERGFALGYFDESYLQSCPVHFLQTADGQVVAFTNQLPELKSSPIATVDLLRYLPAADDAMPYLIAKAIEHINRANRYEYFDLGFVPFAAAKDTAIKITAVLSRGRFSAKGLEQFKSKFDPNWQPIYMAYDGDLADLALIAVNLEKVMSL